MDRGETLDDDAVLSEPLRTLCQSYCNNHGQQLGRQSDGKRQREQERLEPRAMEERVGGEHEQDEEDREAQHQEAELANAVLERILWAAARRARRQALRALSRAPCGTRRRSRSR